MAKKRKLPRRWTASEDALLREAVAQNDSTTIDWQEVATHLEGRTNKDCRKRWVSALRIVVTKGPWGQDEDQRLEAGVEQHGCRWNKVSEVVGTRQADQCSRRWHECLNPIINRSRWSLLEDSTLECAVRIYGRNWTEIVERFFNDRSPIAARNRYEQRFNKGGGGSNIGVSQNQDQHMSPVEEESPSPSSSTFEGNNDDQPLPLSCSEPSDVSAYCHLSAPYIPLNSPFNDGNLVSSLGSSGINSGLASLEPFPTCPPMDVPSGGTYSEATKPLPDTLCSRNEPKFTSGSLIPMTLPDIEEAFRELSTPVPGGFGANTNIASPRSDYPSVISSTSGLATPATTPLPLSSTAAPMPDWYQLPNSLSLDQMIQQLMSYRAQMAEVQGSDFPATQSWEEGFGAEQGVRGDMAWK